MKSNIGPWNEFRCVKPCGVERISKSKETVVEKLASDLASVQITHNGFEENKE
jgi:hypothetical protein